MVYDAMDILAGFITADDSSRLAYKTRQTLLKHIDVTQANCDRHLTTPASKSTYGGYLQGQQAIFATFLAEHDRSADAVELFTRVLELQSQELGPSDLGTLATTNNLSILHFGMQKYTEAEHLLRKVLKGKEKLFPPNDWRITNTINELGNVCNMLDHIDEANALFMHNLKTFSEHGTGSSYDLKAVYNNLGEVAMRQGNLPEAASCFKTALREDLLTVPLYYPSLIPSPKSVSRPFLLPPLPTVDSSKPLSNLNDLDCLIYSHIACLFRTTNQPQLGIPIYKSIILSYTALLGPHHSKTLSAVRTLGDTYHETGELELARGQYLRCEPSREMRAMSVASIPGAIMSQPSILMWRRLGGDPKPTFYKGLAEI